MSISPRHWMIAWWCWLAAIATGSLVPQELLPTEFLWDKLQHAGGYVVLGLIPILVAATWRRASAYLIGAFLFGIAIEVLQGATTTRHFDLWDIAANTIGILAGAGAATALRGLLSRFDTATRHSAKESLSPVSGTE